MMYSSRSTGGTDDLKGGAQVDQFGKPLIYNRSGSRVLPNRLIYVDSSASDIELSVSDFKPGESATVINAGPNMVYVSTVGKDTIHGWTIFPLSPTFCRTATFVCVKPGRLEVQGFNGRRVWFEWNGINIDQFDSLVNGDRLASSSAAIVSYCNLNWINLAAVNGASAGNGNRSAVIMPIKHIPPTENYRVSCEFLVHTFAGALVYTGAGVVARQQYNSTQCYTAHYAQQSASPYQRIAYFPGGTGAVTQIGVLMSDPTLGSTSLAGGIQAAIEVAGNGSNVCITGEFGERQVTSFSTVLSRGAAGITVSTGGSANDTSRAYFRNITVELLD